MRIIIKWVIASGALLVAPYIISGISISNFYSALVAVFVLGILHITIRPILLVLTLPINLLTLGLFSLVINAIIFLLLSTIVKGFQVDGFMAAFLGALFVSAVMFITEKILKGEDE